MQYVLPRLNDAIAHIQGDFNGKDIVSLDQFSASDLHTVFSLARQMKQLAQYNEPSHILEGLVVALLFFEPSSRTFGSFSAAVKRLGGQTLEIQNPEIVSSVSKGESFEDTIRVFEAYSNALVLRHSVPGAALQAAQAAEFIPVVNAGDGNNEHPTQTLLDLFTLYEQFGRLDYLTGLVAGDLANSRTLHSLIRGLSLFRGNTIYLLASERLRLAPAELAAFEERGIRLIEISSEKDIPKTCNFWYWTRIQRERLAAGDDYQGLMREQVIVTPQLLKEYASPDMILLDPLPRVGTIDPSVDADPRAVYLRSQIRNGMYVRMALLALILGRA
ncbi:MAG TPA: aspartate carbamoyltransferase [Ktedonobacteraceae bacterium]|jgi:aspartate carbamoyltransferase